MIDELIYRDFMGCPIKEDIPLGGQELILGEVVGALLARPSPEKIWLPFPAYALMAALTSFGIEIVTGDEPLNFDAVYFGTPTIVNDRRLFQGPAAPDAPAGGWTKQSERETVQAIVAWAAKRNAKRIVSGLGSGDITLDERLQDMGGGTLAAYKDFGNFEDWVLRRDM